MEIRMQIEGLDDALAMLDNTVRADALRDGLRAAALFVEGQAKIKAPVDTGFLRNSIQVVSVTSWEAVVAAAAEYAIYQEMGTRFMPAHPFMRPALESNREQIGRIVSDAIARRARR